MKWPSSTVISWRILTLNFQSCHGGKYARKDNIAAVGFVCVCVHMHMLICVHVCDSDHSKRKVLIMVGRSLELSFKNVKALFKIPCKQNNGSDHDQSCLMRLMPPWVFKVGTFLFLHSCAAHLQGTSFLMNV